MIETVFSFLDKNAIPYETDVPMSERTTFRLGGVAPLMVSPSSAAQMSSLIGFLQKQEIPYFVMGNGSNLIVSDEVPEIVFIRTLSMNGFYLNGTRLIADAGCRNSTIAVAAMNAGLTGLEFLHGIPGSVGGAIAMNAGAYGGVVSDVLQSVTYADEDGILRTSSIKQEDFGYRKSPFSSPDRTVCSAVFQLKAGDRRDIQKTMNELIERRRSSQPLEYPSAGSIFKRPEGYYASKLIQDCGLKGVTVGGAQVSEKHAGFIINKGNATAEDVLALIRQIQKNVEERYHVRLEPEVRVI